MLEPQVENLESALGVRFASTLTETLTAAEGPQPKQTALKTRSLGKQDVSASPAKAKQPPGSGTRKAGQSLEGLPQCQREQVPAVFKGNPLLERSDVHLLLLPQHKKDCSENQAWQAMQSYGVSPELCPSNAVQAYLLSPFSGMECRMTRMKNIHQNIESLSCSRHATCCQSLSQKTSVASGKSQPLVAGSMMACLPCPNSWPVYYFSGHAIAPQSDQATDIVQQLCR